MHSNKFRSQSRSQNSHQLNWAKEHLCLIFQVLTYLLAKISEANKYIAEQQNITKRKSLIKLYDKNIDRLPQRFEQHNNLIFQEPTVLLQKIETFKLDLGQLDKHEESEEWMESKVKQIEEQVSMMSQRVEKKLDMALEEMRQLSQDVGELIILYKDSMVY